MTRQVDSNPTSPSKPASVPSGSPTVQPSTKTPAPKK